jgi:Ca2+/Na+ antiporter
MYLAEKFTSDGSEDLLEIIGPGILGAIFLPILTSLPDALIVLASGLNGSQEIAQIEVSVGMGLLAGSTIMLLTIVWGSCIVVGKCDIEGSIALDTKDTKGLTLTGSGVSTDIWTCYSARIMLASVIPFFIGQVVMSSYRDFAVMASLVMSVSLLISYCLYQVFQPWIQKRRLAYAKHKHLISGLLRNLHTRALGKLVSDDGTPDADILIKLFNTIDINSDGTLSAPELRALIIGIEFEGLNLDENDAVDKILQEFDTSMDGQIDLQEFIDGITRWLLRVKRSSKVIKPVHVDRDEEKMDMQLISDYHTRTKMEQELLGDNDDENTEKIENAGWNTFKAVVLLIMGTVIALSIAHPFVDSINNFSIATSIPPFYVSFVLLPFIRCSEGLSILIFAARKKHRTASLTFSQIYAAVTMSHIFSLSVFLALFYVRQLTWDFSSEVLIIIIVCLIIGILASFKTTFPLWMSFVAFLLYPLSPLFVYILDRVYG